MDKSSKPSKSSSAWAVKARQYLALRDKAYLNHAIVQAEKGGLEDVASMLKALDSRRFQSIDERAPRLHQSLINDKREEEAWTVALIHIDLQAQLAQVFSQFPPEQQPDVLGAGLEASIQALEIARQLGDKPCQGFYGILAARAFSKQTELEEAEKAFNEVLDVYKKLAKKHPKLYKQYVAITLNDRSHVLSDSKRLEEAEKDLNKAHGIYKKLAEKNPKLYKPDVASTLNNRGNVLRNLNRLDAAGKDYNEALGIYKKLAEEHPKLYKPDVATTLNNRGNVLHESKHLKEAEEDFNKALGIYKKLAEKHPELYKPNMAGTLNNRGIVLSDLKRLEEAEKDLNKAHGIYKKLAEEHPKLYKPDVASTLNNRGNVVRNLNRLDAAEKDYNEALDIYKKLAEKDPKLYKPDVATTLNNRGNILRNLNRLDAAEKDYNEALDIYLKLAEEHPKLYKPDLAVTLNGRGHVFRGLRHLKEAEKDFNKALGIYKKLAEKDPKLYKPDVATTLNNRGHVLSDLKRLEEAEKDYNEALDIYLKLAEEHPKLYKPDLAITLNNRGHVLRNLNRLEEAEKDFNKALDIYIKLAEEHPKLYKPDVASTLNNRGNVLHERKHLKEAEKDFNKALGIYKKLAEKDPKLYKPDVATTLNNRGNILRNLNRLEEAEKDYNEALDIYKKLAEKDPKLYKPNIAGMLNNLGNVLRDLKRPEEAKICYKKAVVFNRLMPDSHRTAKPFTNFGRLLNKTGQYPDALDYLKEAVEIVEQRRALAISLDRRIQILGDNTILYEQLLICLLKLGRFPEALEVAEKGKSRTLVDLLSLNDPMPKNMPLEILQEYKEILFRAHMLKDKLQHPDERLYGRNRLPTDKKVSWQKMQVESARRELTKMHGKLNKLVEKIREYDPDFLPHAKPLNLNQIKELAKQSRSSLVLFRVTDAGSFVFMVFPDGEMDAIELKDFTAKRLSEMLVKFDDNGNLVDGWLQHYINYRQLPRSKKRRQRWFEIIEHVTGELYEEMLKHVHARLNRKLGKNGKKHRIVLVPNRGLAILPLHACWWKENGEKRYLLDDFTVSYAPSLSVYKRCHEREKEDRGKDSLFGIANPEPPGNLVFSEWLCTEIVRMFGEKNCRMLWRGDATKQELMKWSEQKNWLHFSCHGEYRMDQPLESALLLAGKNEADKLTLGEIFEQVNLPESWLVVLSACETGLVDFTEIADEHYGLPIGFIYAGVPTVWSTLWTVNDNPTAILMIKAYDELLRNHKSKAEALIAAQKWLRDAYRDEIIDFAKHRGKDVDNGNVLLPQVESFLRLLRKKYKESERPFYRPYFWAAMQCVGV